MFIKGPVLCPERLNSPFVPGNLEKFSLCPPQLLLKAFLLLGKGGQIINKKQHKRKHMYLRNATIHYKIKRRFWKWRDLHKPETSIFSWDFCIFSCSQFQRLLVRSCLKPANVSLTRKNGWQCKKGTFGGGERRDMLTPPVMNYNRCTLS